jgi:hypothetical protein
MDNRNSNYSPGSKRLSSRGRAQTERSSPYPSRRTSAVESHPVEDLITTFQFKAPSDIDLNSLDDDERKKQMRLMKNRLAARESRLKKKQQYIDMQAEIDQLKEENRLLKLQVHELKLQLVEAVGASENRSVNIKTAQLDSQKQNVTKAPAPPQPQKPNEIRLDMDALEQFFTYEG